MMNGGKRKIELIEYVGLFLVCLFLFDAGS